MSKMSAEDMVHYLTHIEIALNNSMNELRDLSKEIKRNYDMSPTTIAHDIEVVSTVIADKIESQIAILSNFQRLVHVDNSVTEARYLFTDDIPKLLVDLRTQYGLENREFFAKLLGIPIISYNLYENGLRKPSEEEMETIVNLIYDPYKIEYYWKKNKERFTDLEILIMNTEKFKTFVKNF